MGREPSSLTSREGLPLLPQLPLLLLLPLLCGYKAPQNYKKLLLLPLQLQLQLQQLQRTP